MKGGQLIILVIVLFAGYTFLQNHDGKGFHYGDSDFAPASATVLIENEDGYGYTETVPVSYETMEDEFEALLTAYNDFLLDDHYETYGIERKVFKDRQRFLNTYLPLMSSKFMREKNRGTLEDRRKRPKSSLFGFNKKDND